MDITKTLSGQWKGDKNMEEGVVNLGRGVAPLRRQVCVFLPVDGVPARGWGVNQVFF